MENFQAREYCLDCRCPKVSCYCKELQPFASTPEFLILMHPKEMRKKIATGRITYRSLSNAKLFVGIDFSNHSEVNELIQSPNYQPYLLYPAKHSKPLAQMIQHCQQHENQNRKPLVIILDGTWRWARNMYTQSNNLQQLPCFRFHKEEPSEFLVRKQPKVYCYATVEAAHHVICEFAVAQNQGRTGPQDQMREIFRNMVNFHLRHTPKGRS